MYDFNVFAFLSKKLNVLLHFCTEEISTLLFKNYSGAVEKTENFDRSMFLEIFFQNEIYREIPKICSKHFHGFFFPKKLKF